MKENINFKVKEIFKNNNAEDRKIALQVVLNKLIVNEFAKSVD